MLVMAGLVACGSGGPELTSKELRIYSFAEYIRGSIVTDFQKETGVEVTVTTYETNEELLAGLSARPTAYDLVIPSDYAVEALIAAGGLKALDLTAIPNHKNIDPGFLNPEFDPGGANKYSLPYLWGTTGIAYDGTRVSPPPSGWDDLWRPELAGKLVVLDDSREMIGLTLLSLGYEKNAQKAEKIDQARDRLKQLAPGVVAFDANNGEGALISGDAIAGVLFSGNAALAARANPNIKWVLPKGGGIWFDSLAIPAGAPHADAATAFIDFVLSAEVGARITADYPFSNPNAAALDWMKEHDPDAWQAYRSTPACNPSATELTGLKLVKDVGPEVTARYEAAWDEVKASRTPPP